jgi:hypothetical protein
VFQKYIQLIRPGQGKESIFERRDIYAVAVFMNLTRNRRHSRKLAGEMISGWVSPVEFGKIKFIAFFFEENQVIAVNYESEKVLAKAMEKVSGWNDVYVINFKELKLQVDQALKSLPDPG